jgi:hypothetical protein
MVVQGDTLRNLYRLADRIFSLSAGLSDLAIREEIEDLREKLREMIIHYENILKEHSFELPYPNHDQVSD